MSDIIEEFMEEDTQKGMYMTFKSGKEHFGVAVKYVKILYRSVRFLSPVNNLETITTSGATSAKDINFILPFIISPNHLTNPNTKKRQNK